jgi:hypothetical protein
VAASWGTFVKLIFAYVCIDFLLQLGISDYTTYTGRDISFLNLARKHTAKLGCQS